MLDLREKLTNACTHYRKTITTFHVDLLHKQSQVAREHPSVGLHSISKYFKVAMHSAKKLESVVKHNGQRQTDMVMCYNQTII